MRPNRKWKNPRWRPQTSNACISVPRQDINEIPTAVPMFSGSSFPTGLGRIPRAQTGSRKDGTFWTSNKHSLLYECHYQKTSQTVSHLCFTLPVWSHIIPTSSSGSLDLKNIGMAVDIPLISCLRAQRQQLKFRGRHLEFFHIRFGYSNESKWNVRHRKHEFSCWNFAGILSGSRDTCIWSFEV